jgi:hypothetical protein
MDKLLGDGIIGGGTSLHVELLWNRDSTGSRPTIGNTPSRDVIFSNAAFTILEFFLG